MDLITKTGTMTTSIVGSDGRVYEIIRDCSDGNCTDEETAVIITLYPTTDDVGQLDLSTLHILNHMKELGIKKIIFLYLFSKVCSARLSTRGLVEDEDNLAMVEQVLNEYSKARVIIGWGTSMSRSVAAVTSKKKVISFLEQREDKRLWQLGCDGLDSSENFHPLFLGIRQGKNCKWRLQPYDIPGELKPTEEGEKLTDTTETSNIVSVKNIGKSKQAEKRKK